jgi:hypothetical protein
LFLAVFACGSPEARIVEQTEQSLSGIWGSSADDIWVGSEGTDRLDEVGGFVHDDGTSWEQQDAPSGIGERVMWGSSASDVWAWSTVYDTTMRIEILRYDGSSWSVSHERAYGGTAIAGEIEITDAWGSGPDDVWFVGVQDQDIIDTSSFILHFDGTSWREVAAPAGATFVQSVWTARRGDVWLIADSALFHDDGTGWQPIEGAPSASRVRGTSSGEVFVAATHSIEQYVDGAFQTVGNVDPGRMIYAIWVESATSIWTVGSQDGNAHTSLSLSCDFLCLQPSLSTGSSTSTFGSVAHWDGSVWSTRILEAYPSTSLWAPGDGRLFFISSGDDPENPGSYVDSVLEWSL